jgi:hypothetical protein
MVTLHPVGNPGPEAIHPVGYVDDQGAFLLTSYKENDGAPEGDYEVTITWFLAAKVAGIHPGDEYSSRNYLPERYASRQSSGLRVTIHPGENDLPPFRLNAK